MEETFVKDSAVRKPKTNKKITWAVLKEQRQLIYMSVPLMAYIILFAYVPIWGWTMAFQNYKPARDFSEQTWVGFKHFEFLLRMKVSCSASQYARNECYQYDSRLYDCNYPCIVTE